MCRRRAPEKSVYEDWVGRAGRGDDRTRPRIGDLGGGSDHVGFVCHLGVPGMAFSGGGSAGSAYHTAYDNLAWYRQVVGEDYEPALMIARMTNGVLGRLVSEARVPVDSSAQPRFVADQLRGWRGNAFVASAIGAEALDEIIRLADEATVAGLLADALAVTAPGSHQTQPDGSMPANRFHSREGLPGRPWFQNLLVASDPDSGYGAYPLPAVRAAIAQQDAAALQRALDDIRQALASSR
ncbi:MAG: hypothetical protein HND58_09530 [Planctomycetota bacterium]|nr:MAG: hypothetical protein HND58_09530 [Planctomycetota bacterium]